MSMTDPIADMLVRIKNAQAVGHKSVRMPASKVKKAIADVLQDEGYIASSQVIETGPKRDLEIELRYYEGAPVIERLERYSRPGLRQYRSREDIPSVRSGLGVAIVSTSAGIMTDRAAREQGIGGEVLCLVA